MNDRNSRAKANGVSALSPFFSFSNRNYIILCCRNEFIAGLFLEMARILPVFLYRVDQIEL